MSEADLPSAGLAFARGASLGHFQLLAAAVYGDHHDIPHVRRELAKAAA
ncbi:MAG TPA: hypothetical protein VG295_01605 [Solirubrobacteraceae bacterium]|nr:hypothetical protein [Solirubrobacteraceae bacterium]